MDLFAIYSFNMAKKLIQAGYELHHVAVFYFVNDGTINDFIKNN